MTTLAERRTCRIHVTGVVQGVGFRPFVYRLAQRHGLTGWVRNESGNVEISIAGAAESIDQFVEDLRAEAPPLARIDGVAAESADTDDALAVDEAFRILESVSVEGRRQPVPADVGMCPACERELFEPSDRRYRYPFITCTDCGPRYTVIESLPYDRERTTMRRFPQCPTCLREYQTPGDRRYHSETNSCPTCGPMIWARLPGESLDPPSRDDPTARLALSLAESFLRGGGIVAVRGVGGFHLAVDATNEHAVRRLRERKHRDAKPLAVMVRTLDDARAIAAITEEEAELLQDRARPIVLLRAREPSSVAAAVAPGLTTIGVMLAYTPLHHLLLDAVRRPLVMTSGNRSEEPIAADIADAAARLDDIADVFLLHDREIESPVDDSVTRVTAAGATMIRRARGYAPIPVKLPHATHHSILAVGGHLKSTFTLAAGREAFVSPHLGDLDSLETLEHFKRTVDRYSRLFRVVPDVVARDLHGGYLSTRLADELEVRDRIIVQHHHAHVAAVLGEHAHAGRVIGVAFDGTGQGDDGTVWGAEFLLADQSSYARIAHVRCAPLPGGDLAVRSPWRSALGYLSLEPSMAATFTYAFTGVDERERHAAERQIELKINAPLASSMGRLFDAAAAVLGVCRHSRFEGDAAMRLEALAGTRAAAPLPFPRSYDDNGLAQLDPLPLFAALAEGQARGESLESLAAGFHEAVAAATADLVAELCTESGTHVAALGGGSFQNARLHASIRDRLASRGLVVLSPIHLPANDGGLSYGQAVVAAAQLAVRER